MDLRAAKTSNVIITPAQRRQLLVSKNKVSRSTVTGTGSSFDGRPASTWLTLQPDLSLGLTEVANCYLEGSGVKKDKNSGLEYLRLAGTTGDLGAQERKFPALLRVLW